MGRVRRPTYRLPTFGPSCSLLGITSDAAQPPGHPADTSLKPDANPCTVAESQRTRARKASGPSSPPEAIERWAAPASKHRAKRRKNIDMRCDFQRHVDADHDRDAVIRTVVVKVRRSALERRVALNNRMTIRNAEHWLDAGSADAELSAPECVAARRCFIDGRSRRRRVGILFRKRRSKRRLKVDADPSGHPSAKQHTATRAVASQCN